PPGVAGGVLLAIYSFVPHFDSAVRMAAGVAGLYADVAPEVLGAIDNVAITSATIVAERSALDSLLLEITGLASTGNRVLTAHESGIVTMLDLMRPTASLLAEYSPGLTCFLQGVDETRKMAEPVSGGNGRTMLLSSAILLGDAPYTYAQDLPRVQATGGPRCGGLPKLAIDQLPAPYLVADTGSNPYRTPGAGPTVSPDRLLEFLVGAQRGGNR
ncbi:MCE family protein, partial [Rhodococcus sp. NPDC058514]|uniref:MCE family protein n=1 Tax=Rhodococcus sp. NPDC058514 TaxID=3346532 RepID=UPI0036607ABA